VPFFIASPGHLSLLFTLQAAIGTSGILPRLLQLCVCNNARTASQALQAGYVKGWPRPHIYTTMTVYLVISLPILQNCIYIYIYGSGQPYIYGIRYTGIQIKLWPT
jgi:hypothetical protein